MQELVRDIPDVALLMALEPEELGAKILFLLLPVRTVEQSSTPPKAKSPNTCIPPHNRS
jgi:hypothetical protein